MIAGALVLSGREWLLPAGGMAAVAAAILVWSYWRAPLDRWIQWVCLGLKLTGLLALAFCLLEPLWTGSRAKPGANLLLLLADNSMGLQVRDRASAQTRADWIRETLTAPGQAWLTALEDQFDVRRFMFDSRLRGTPDFSELDFQGRESALARALQTLNDRYRGQPVAGILVFSDGNATDRLDTSMSPAADVPPVYPILVGQRDGVRDVGIANVTVSQTAFEDAPVTVQAQASALGYARVPIRAQLEDATGRLLEDQVQVAPANGDAVAFRFRFRPERPGVGVHRLVAAPEHQPVDPAGGSASAEATLMNNSRWVVVNRVGGPYRILYVSGRPNWEFKFLRRALAEDDQLRLSSLIRIARREPKFEFRARDGQSNPLFRGFDGPSDDTERYDQPVFRWIDPPAGTVAGAGFPADAETLYAYHAIILDDLEAAFFTYDQMTLLQRFVSERGGGFVVLGGAESLAQGGYDRTPVGEMLPMYLDLPSSGQPAAALRLELTREGWLQPWVRLRNTEVAEQTRLDTLPPYWVLNKAQDARPGASILATVADPGGRIFPALASQRFGLGRTAAVLVGDLWRAGLGNETFQADLLKSWRQLIRWMVTDVPAQVSLNVNTASDDANPGHTLEIRVRDRRFEPMDDAVVRLRVQSLADGGGFAAPTDSGFTNAPVIELSAEPSLKEPGLYEAAFFPRSSGVCIAEAVVTDAAGAEVGRTEIGWAVDPIADEFRALEPNHALLETLAARSGGSTVAPSELGRFAGRLPFRPAPVRESWTFPLWHHPIVFGLALVCLLAEWGLRRWQGLP